MLDRFQEYIQQNEAKEESQAMELQRYKDENER